MKFLAHIIAVVGIMFLTSGCTTSAQGQLNGMNAGSCNNPKCSCPKPCQCGSGCQCGMKGNSNKMNGNN